MDIKTNEIRERATCISFATCPAESQTYTHEPEEVRGLVTGPAYSYHIPISHVQVSQRLARATASPLN
jgi:hypothetical protein